MKIIVRQLLLGASCFCFLRTAIGIGHIATSTCELSKTNMSSSASKPEEFDYVPGSSSIAYITTPDETIAKKLARSLVENRLSACVNIIPKITSIYVWEDKVQDDTECMLIVKTRTSRVKDVTKFIRENHPYSVAEVISTPIDQGNPAYMHWIEQTVKEVDSN